MVPLRKSDGSLCCALTIGSYKSIRGHMMPTLDEITAMLSGSIVFSVLDAESGFHQLPLSAESRNLTKFSSHCGLFRFKRLSFGIACAPILSNACSGLF